MATRPRLDEARHLAERRSTGTATSPTIAAEDRDDRPRSRDAEEMSRAECEARLSVLLRCT